MKYFRLLRDYDNDSSTGGGSDHKKDISESRNYSKIEKSERGSFGSIKENRLPNFEHTPPPPNTPHHLL